MPSCPSCNAPISANTTFCAECGSRVAQPPADVVAPTALSPQAAPVAPSTPPSPDAMRICRTCGTIGTLEAQACPGCAASLANPAYAEVRPDGVMFAQILESDFQCRSCGLRSTLDSLCVEGEVDCSRCGTTQAFDVDQWADSLKHAHDVADLSGPPPGGQGSLRHRVPLKGSNPYASLGVRNTFAEHAQNGMTISAAGVTQRSLRVKVTTGHPVCPKGHGPVVVELDGSGSARVTCATCNEPATYLLPSKASSLASGCVGVIDDEHRQDRPLVRVEPSSGGGGAVALACPRCNASLPATQASSVVTCQFCNTVSYLPRRAFNKLNKDRKSKPFWLLFRGPSPKRIHPEGGPAIEDDDEKAVPAPAEASGTAPAQAASAPLASSDRPKPSTGRSGALIFGIVAVAVAVAAIIGAVALRSHSASPRPSAPPPPHAGPHRPSH